VLAEPRFIGSPRATAGAVSIPAGASQPTVPWIRTPPGSSFLASSPLQSSFAFAPARDLSARVQLPWVPALLAASLGASTSSPGFEPTLGLRSAPIFRQVSARASRASLRSVLRFSQPLDGLLRTRAARVYFAPQPRPGFQPVQGIISRCSRSPSSRESLPPCRWLRTRSAAPKDLRPRTRHLDFEASLHTGQRALRFGDQPRRRPLPSSGSLSSRSPLGLGRGLPVTIRP
jgi:hypothetical protein